MDPDFTELLADQRPPVCVWLDGLGVSSASDLRHFWASAGDLAAEWTAGPGQELDAEIALELVALYQKAKSRAEVALRSNVRALTLERQSRFEPSSSLKRTLSVSPPPAAPKARMLIPHRVAAAPVPVITIADSGTQPVVCQEEQKPRKLLALFLLACEVFLNLDDVGAHGLDLSDSSSVAQVAERAMVGAQRLSLRRIGGLAATLRRWKSFAADRGFGVSELTPDRISQFLLRVSQGGPTAASAVFAAFRWFNENLGACFPLSHFLVKPFRFHAVGHMATQAAELQPWEFLNIIRVCSELTGTPRMLALFAIQAAVSCIRFEHFGRSVLLKDHGSWLEFRCSEGKSRKQGVRPAYNWATPALKLYGVDLIAELRAFFQHEALPESKFLWPAVQLSRQDLWQITESCPFLLDKKLSGPRFLEFFRGLLCRGGVPPATAAVAGFNRLRRFLPTGAQVLQLHPQEAQAIGSWVEMPSAGTGQTAAGSAPRRIDLMSTHYSGERVLASMQAKAKVLCRVVRHDTAQGSSLLPMDALRWPAFSGVFGPEPGPPMPEAACCPHVQGSDSDSSDSTSSSSQSSGSSASASVDAELLAAVEWLRQLQRFHIVRERDLDGRPVPWCRQNAFTQDPSATGQASNLKPSARVCQRCLTRMPSALRSALQSVLNEA